MIQNNDNSYSSDFDELNHCLCEEKTSHSSAMQGLEKFVVASYRGYDYQVPICLPLERQAVISDFQFQAGNQAHRIHEGIFRLYLSISEPSEIIDLHLTIPYEAYEPHSSDDVNEVGLYLYREGEQNPLDCHLVRIDESYDLNFYLSNSFHQLRPGRYFILAQNIHWQTDADLEMEVLNGHLIWPFLVLAAGEQLSHPVLKQVTVEPLMQWTSGMQKIHLQWAEKLPAGNDWMLSVYTDTWRKMGEAVCYISSHQSMVQDLTFQVESALIWLPGNYLAVLSHNREPYAAISFSLSEQNDEACTFRMLSSLDNEYWLVKEVEQNIDLHWEEANQWPGFHHLWQRLTQLNREERFNHLSVLQSPSALKRCGYAVVTAPGQFRDLRLSYYLPLWLNFFTLYHQTIDCNSWVHRGENNWTLDNNNLGNPTFILYNLSVFQRYPQKVNELLQFITSRFTYYGIILCGTATEVDEFFSLNPQLKSLFSDDYRFDIQSYSWKDTVYEMQRCLKQAQIQSTSAAEHQLAETVYRNWSAIKYWEQTEIQAFVQDSIVSSCQNRVQRTYSQCNKHFVQAESYVCLPEDIHLSAYLVSQVDVVSDSI